MESIKILIVEDDPDTQTFLKLFLGKKFIIKVCPSDAKFYETIKEFKFDIVIMDIGIKGEKDGLELTRELRSMPEYSKTPIICFSAHVLERDQKRAYEAGVDIFLGKPVENSVLLQTINELTNTRDKE